MSFICAMEAAENEDLVVDQSSTGEADAAVAEETNNIVEATAEIEGDAKLVEKAGGDVEELAVLGDKAEKALESGEGLSEDAAEIAIVAVEHALFRLGMRAEEIARRMPAQESFGNTHTRLDSTRLVVETIGETISRVWNHIKSMAKMIVEKIIGFFGKLFNSVIAIRKSLDILKKRVADLPAGATAEKTELTGSLAKALEVGGSADMNTWKQLCANTGKLADFSNKASELRYKKLNGLASAAGSNKLDYENLVSEGSKLSTEEKRAADGLPKASGTRTNWSNTQSYGPFPGGVIMTIGFKTNEDAEVGATSVVFEKVKEPKAEKIAVLMIPQISEVIQEAEALLKRFETFKKTIPEEKNIVAKIGAICDKIIAQASKNKSTEQGAENSDDQKKAFEAVRRNVTASMNVGSSLLNNAPSLMFRAVSVSYEYASKSLGQYSAPKK